jgi:hypothetical protein
MIARRLPRTPTRDQLQPVRNYPHLKGPMAAALLCDERVNEFGTIPEPLRPLRGQQDSLVGDAKR